jgi:hypothetical protein
MSTMCRRWWPRSTARRSQQAAMQQQTTGQEVDQDELKAQVADLLVDNELLKQAADDAGIEVSDEDVDAFLEETAQQNGLGSGDELISAMEQQGQDEEQIRSDAADQVQLDAYLEKEADITEPTDRARVGTTAHSRRSRSSKRSRTSSPSSTRSSRRARPHSPSPMTCGRRATSRSTSDPRDGTPCGPSTRETAPHRLVMMKTSQAVLGRSRNGNLVVP